MSDLRKALRRLLRALGQIQPHGTARALKALDSREEEARAALQHGRLSKSAEIPRLRAHGVQVPRGNMVDMDSARESPTPPSPPISPVAAAGEPSEERAAAIAEAAVLPLNGTEIEYRAAKEMGTAEIVKRILPLLRAADAAARRATWEESLPK